MLRRLLTICLCVPAAITVLLVIGRAGEQPAEPAGAFDQDLYAWLKAGEVGSPSELAADYNLWQLVYVPILPPDPDLVLCQSGGLLAFDPAGFPASFRSGLVPEVWDGVTVYPVTVMEDPITRERVFFNARDERIGLSPAPVDYDPFWYLIECGIVEVWDGKAPFPQNGNMQSDEADRAPDTRHPTPITTGYSMYSTPRGW